MTGKKFQFSLEPVLQLRKHEAEQVRLALAQAVQRRIRQEEIVTQARRRLDDACRPVQARGAFDMATLRQLEAFRQAARLAYDQACTDLRALQQSENQVRSELIDKRCAEEALQTLYDQELQRHRQAEEATETKILDEQALDSFRRQRTSSDS